MKGIGLHTAVNEDGAAILDVERGEISTLNSTGAYIWQALQRGQALDTIVHDLARETGTETEVVDRDVRNFIETLKAKQLFA
jgi:hypothetical protein